MNEARYRCMLRGQQYLDEHVMDPRALHFLTCDLFFQPWSKALYRPAQWARVSTIALQQVRPEDRSIIGELFRGWGFDFQVYHPVGSLLFLSRERSEDVETYPGIPMLRVGSTVVVGYTGGVPSPWPCVPAAARVILGLIGIDRHIPLMARVTQRSLGFHHAWCTPTAPPDYGLATHARNEWRQVCYVSPSIPYADCHPLRLYDVTWLYCRLLETWPPPDLPLPWSLHMHHDFSDYPPVSPALQAEIRLARQLLELLKRPHLIDVLRWIRRRNLEGAQQPGWKTLQPHLESPEEWTVMETLALVVRQVNTVLLLPRGDFVVHMARPLRCG